MGPPRRVRLQDIPVEPEPGWDGRDDLGAAWAEAEAAIRRGDGELFELRIGIFAGGEYWADGWHGQMDAGPRGTDMRGITEHAHTPAAALRALAAKLRDKEE